MTDAAQSDEFPYAQASFDLMKLPTDRYDLWAPLFSGTQEWCSRCYSTSIALNKQWLDFLQMRAEADFALPQRLMACKTPSEAWTAYVGFLQKAATDYQSEISDLGKYAVISSASKGSISK